MKKVLFAAVLSCSGAALTLPLPATAQSIENDRENTPTLKLDPIQVQGEQDRTEQARERLERRAGGTSVVEAEAYDQGRATTLSDVFTYTPGVFTRDRHGEETRISIRGSGIQRGFLMRGIQLYQDGIPLNYADGAGDFQSVDPLAAEHVEVWRGGNALEYGASSLGGAINFVTPTGRTAPPAKVRLDAGSYGQRRGQAALAGARGDLDGILGVTASKQNGWRENSETESIRASGNVGYQINDRLEGRVYLSHIDSEMRIPGSLTRAQLDEDPRQARARSSELKAANDYIENRIAPRFTWTPSNDTEITTSAYYATRDRYHPTTRGVLQQDTQNFGLDLRSSIDMSSETSNRQLVMGVSTARYIGEEDRFTNNNGNPGTLTRDTELDGRTHTLYGEYSHGLTDALTVQVGAQLTRAVRKLTNNTDPTDSYDETFDGFSPKLGAIYQLNETQQFYGNVSRSFEPSPFGEAPVRDALPLPDAQEATTFELGWRLRSDRITFDAAVYHSRIDDELLALTDSTGVSIGTSNADSTIHQGVELGGSMALTDTIDLRAAYLWNDFKFDGDEFYGNNTIAGIAPHSLNAEVSWTVAPWLIVSPAVEWSGGTTWIDHANTVAQSGYTLAHLRLHGDFGRGLSWFADVRNVADRDYVSSVAVQANADGQDGSYYFPGTPRTVFFGLTWEY